VCVYLHVQELSSRADAATTLCSCLEALRGATRATLGRTQQPLWAISMGLLGPLLALQVCVCFCVDVTLSFPINVMSSYPTYQCTQFVSFALIVVLARIWTHIEVKHDRLAHPVIVSLHYLCSVACSTMLSHQPDLRCACTLTATPARPKF
jgi:hypothetical protein